MHLYAKPKKKGAVTVQIVLESGTILEKAQPLFLLKVQVKCSIVIEKIEEEYDSISMPTVMLILGNTAAWFRIVMITVASIKHCVLILVGIYEPKISASLFTCNIIGSFVCRISYN